MLVWKLVFFALAVGVAFDGRRRAVSTWPLWAFATFVMAPFVVPAYLSLRPLRGGERRIGGRAWCVCSRFALLWTVILAVGAGELWLRTRTSPPSAFPRLIDLLGRGGLWIVYAAIWLVPVLAALTVGLATRRSSAVEVGRTNAA